MTRLQLVGTIAAPVEKQPPEPFTTEGQSVAINPIPPETDVSGFAQASIPGLLDIRRYDLRGEIAVAVNGEVDLLGHELLRECLLAALEDASVVTVDLSGTTFMDSTGLNVLITTSRRAGEMGGRMFVRGADSRLRKLFEISGALSILAVDGFGERPAAR